MKYIPEKKMKTKKISLDLTASIPQPIKSSLLALLRATHTKQNHTRVQYNTIQDEQNKKYKNKDEAKDKT